ncbi:MAG: hypothetical protein IJ469_02290 [Candidatus Methanomethylophilaceae archaeon]|nr:hypothetical protein [Candidatus Methanomethylophilaceae archaeon]
MKYDDRIKQEILKNISDLFVGHKIDFNTILSKYDRLLSGKNNRGKMGLLSEFIAHILLISFGYDQKFLFLNLEEGSAKKGFDGLYKLGDDIWIMESKSGSSTDDFIKAHRTKMKKALEDLDNKMSSRCGNNPWQNALNHARVVRAEEDLLKKLEILDSQFERGEKIKKDQFCIIPSSTTFSNPPKIPAEGELERLLLENEYQKAMFLCISHDMLNRTEEYIREVISDEATQKNAKK